MLVCGLGTLAEELRQEFEGEAGIPVEPLRSRFGAPHYYDAGLLGYLESVEELAA